jgi:hypothetical protein
MAFDISHYAPKDPLAFQTWADCLHWALGEADIKARFEIETGNKWSPPKSQAEKMIDEATEAAVAYLQAFVPWFNENVWGDE